MILSLEQKIKLLVFILHRDFVRAEKYKTEAETFGWSFVFQDFVSDELKSKVTQRIEVRGGDLSFLAYSVLTAATHILGQ